MDQDQGTQEGADSQIETSVVKRRKSGHGEIIGGKIFDTGDGQVEGGDHTGSRADDGDKGEDRVKGGLEGVNKDEEQCGRYNLRSKRRRIL